MFRNPSYSAPYAGIWRSLGEAASRFDAEFRAAHPEIPWRKMISTRNVLIHNYDDASPEIVWGIVEHDIPPLLEAVRKLIEATPE